MLLHMYCACVFSSACLILYEGTCHVHYPFHSCPLEFFFFFFVVTLFSDQWTKKNEQFDVPHVLSPHSNVTAA